MGNPNRRASSEICGRRLDARRFARYHPPGILLCFVTFWWGFRDNGTTKERLKKNISEIRKNSLANILECNRLFRNINHTCRPELCISFAVLALLLSFDLRHHSFRVCGNNDRPNFHYDSMALCFSRFIRLWSEHGHGLNRYMISLGVGVDYVIHLIEI